MTTKEVIPLAVRKKEAARMLGVSEKTLYNWTKAGKLKATKNGTARSDAVLYSIADLQAFLGQAK
jgi:excisionase family DNA binding protein